MRELNFLSAVSMAEQIRRKRLSPVELVESHLTRIEELNPRLNAFVQVDAEAARRQARVAEEAAGNGEKLGPLHGVPLSIKSSIERSEEHTSELQSRLHLVCRLLLEKKKKKTISLPISKKKKKKKKKKK